jgi:hypothetical protein
MPHTLRRQPGRLPTLSDLHPGQPVASIATPDVQPVLLAERARTLPGHGAPCAVCGRACLRGDRVADLAGGRGLVHVGCIGRRP